MARPTILAIDSSTERAGLCIDDGERVTELSWAAGRTQTVTLLGQIHHLLGLHGITAPDISAIVVATGPGTFTGLRVGMSVAKGLVLGLGVPLIGVPTLAATALPDAGSGPPVVPLVAAGRGRLVWATYGDAAGIWGLRVPPRNGTLEELTTELADHAGTVLLTGEIDREQAKTLAGVPGVRLTPPALRGRRPAALATLGRQKLETGDVDDPIRLEPTYLGR